MNNPAKTGFDAPPPPVEGEFEGLRIAIISTRWNAEVIGALLHGAHRALSDWGFTTEQVIELKAPGAYELPLAAQSVIAAGRADAVVALGAVIRGDTPHFEYVAGECARGLMDVQLKTGKPVVFGVLTVNTDEQARERCGPGNDNKGYEAVAVALDMLRFQRGVCA